jgi:hypothetical protein
LCSLFRQIGAAMAPLPMSSGVFLRWPQSKTVLSTNLLLLMLFVSPIIKVAPSCFLFP